MSIQEIELWPLFTIQRKLISNPSSNRIVRVAVMNILAYIENLDRDLIRCKLVMVLINLLHNKIRIQGLSQILGDKQILKET